MISQDFAPIGAKWHYTETIYQPHGGVSFFTAEVIKDTTIKDKQCRQIVSKGQCGYHTSDTNYVYQEDSIVFFYNINANTFQILYNFKAKKGDSWTSIIYVMHKFLDTLIATVDTVFTVSINGFDLIRQGIKYTYPGLQACNICFYTAEVTEIIGDIHFLFNLQSNKVICDGSSIDGLRCYEDSQFGFYSTGIADSCEYIYTTTGIPKAVQNFDFELFPNPTSGYLRIMNGNNDIMTFELRDMFGGVLLIERFINSAMLDIKTLPDGLYIATVSHDNKIIGHKKIVKY